MPRPRISSRSGTGRDAGGADALMQTADRMVGQIEALVREMASLRQENDVLRDEVRQAVSMFEQASAVLDDLPVPRRRGRAISVDGAGDPGRRRAGRGRTRGRRGRATPAEVTPTVVQAIIGKLGPSTASEIAAEISRHGSPVSGRAVRFLAERAGAQVTVSEDGQRRYSL